MKDFSCIGLDFSMNGEGELKSNFTFKFPAKTGFYYHVPSYSPVNTIFPAIWDTKHRGGKYLRFMILQVNFNLKSFIRLQYFKCHDHISFYHRRININGY